MSEMFCARKLRRNRHRRLYSIKDYRRKDRGTAFHEAPIGKAPYARGIVLNKT